MFLGAVPNLAQVRQNAVDIRLDTQPLLTGNDDFQSAGSQSSPKNEHHSPLQVQDSMRVLPQVGTSRDWRQHVHQDHETPRAIH